MIEFHKTKLLNKKIPSEISKFLTDKLTNYLVIKDGHIIVSNLEKDFSDGKKNDALRLREKCVSVLEPLYNNKSERWVKDYHASLKNLADSYIAIDKIDESIQLLDKSITILEPLYHENPDRWTEYYIRSINNLINTFHGIDKKNMKIGLSRREFLKAYEQA